MNLQIQYKLRETKRFEECYALWNCHEITRRTNFSLFLRYARNVASAIEGIEIGRGREKSLKGVKTSQ